MGKIKILIGWCCCKKPWCIPVCAPVCAQLQQEEWFLIMIINIYQFHLLPCIGCWTWMSAKKATCSLGLFSSSVCREHWVWLYKLQFLYFYEMHFFSHLLPEAGPTTSLNPLQKVEKKEKANGTRADHTSNTYISTGLCVVAAAMFAPTHRPPQQWLSHRLAETISSWIFSSHMLET